MAKIVGWILSPLAIVLGVWSIALLLAGIGKRWAAVLLGSLGFFGLWLAASPWVAQELAYELEQRHPAVSVEHTPVADAILVLGGGLSGANLPTRPHFDLGPAADRVWLAAALYRAGKAQWVLVSGGNQPAYVDSQVEAEAIREMLLALGVPDRSIRFEGASRSTIENARASRGLVQAVGARKVLLVTSAMHMPRALALVQRELSDDGIIVLSASTDVVALPGALHPAGRWLPDAEALALSTRALKEYLALGIGRIVGHG